MFDIFYNKYVDELYAFQINSFCIELKTMFKNHRKHFINMVILLFLSVVAFYFYAYNLFVFNYTISIMSFSFICLFTAIMYISDKKYRNRKSESLINQYKQNHIDKLNALLSNFGYLNEQKVDWLIVCCSDKIQNDNLFSDFSEFIAGFIVPVALLLLQLKLDAINYSEHLIDLFFLLLPILFLSFFLFKLITWIIRSLHLSKRSTLAILKEDLEYIKSSFSNP